MTAVLLDAATPVPKIADGMTVHVVYKGRQKIKWEWEDSMGRRVHVEWWNEDTSTWQRKPVMCTEPFTWADPDGVSRPEGRPILMYDSVIYPLAVNRDAYMPIEAARCWFGDERSREMMGTEQTRRGTVAWMNDRATERRRLRCLYDNRLGSEEEIIGHPVVEVYMIEGERVPMVLDDPLGRLSTAAGTTVASAETMLAQLKAATERISQLERQVGLDTGKILGPRRIKAPKEDPRYGEEDTSPDAKDVGLEGLPEDPSG